VEGSHQSPNRLLRIERSDQDGATHLRLIGELDLSTIDPLKLRLELVEKEAPSVMVVDLRGVTFMDSMGLGILLSHRLQANKEGRRFVLIEGPSHVQQVFSATGVSSHFEWADSPT
jgi:stage II sporulation protein AA (anti-sigma F factor antagonist)